MAGATFSRANSKSKEAGSDPALQTNTFGVVIDGIAINGCNQVSGMEQEFDVVIYKDGEDGIMHTRPGNLKPGKLTLTKDFTNTPELADWFLSAKQGAPKRVTVAVTFRTQGTAGSDSGSMEFYECWPIKHKLPDLNAQQSGNAQEVIEISYETSLHKFG